jgi:VWFA-related protein
MRLILIASLWIATPANGQPLLPGRPSEQSAEVHYDPASGTVTIKFPAPNSKKYFTPNLRRADFAVYDNGIRQSNFSATIEHGPVSIGILLERGGRHPSVNRDFKHYVDVAAHQLLSALGRNDKVAVWTYGNSLKQLADFSADHDALDLIIQNLSPPEISETNLYDGLIGIIARMRNVPGPKAIVLISSGIDTFSRMSYQDALEAARESDAPIYAISLGPALEQAAQLRGMQSLEIDWMQGETRLGEIASASGGRLYSPPNIFDLSSIYDDFIQNLTIRYTVSYTPSNGGAPGEPRTVRVELTRKIEAANGGPVRSALVAEGSYMPVKTSEYGPAPPGTEK